MEKILVVAPHPDDETLGMGGTIAKMSESGHDVTVVTVSAHMPPLYPEEVHQTTMRESRAAHQCLGVKESKYLGHAAVSLKGLDDSVLNGELLEEVRELNPTQVYIPFFDRHSDHRAVFEAAMVATRPVGAGTGIRLFAAYETLSSTHWNAPNIEPAFNPNFFVDVTGQIDTKLAAMAKYQSQLHDFPAPRSLEALRALALFRGSQSGSGYAESFQVIRMRDSAIL
jgi:LmbE family N-acetylglucosaminyl deacetylase